MANNTVQKLKRKLVKTSPTGKLLLLLSFLSLTFLTIIIAQRQQEIRMFAAETASQYTPPWFCFGLGTDCSKVAEDPANPANPLNKQTPVNQQPGVGSNSAGTNQCAGLTVTSPLKLDKTTVLLGGTVKGSMTLTNNCSLVFSVNNAFIQAVDPKGVIYTFNPYGGTRLLMPKQEIVLNADFTVPTTASAGAWTAVGVVSTGSTQNTNIGEKVSFTVQEPCTKIDMTTPLNVKPNPVPLGQTATANIIYKNNCKTEYTLKDMGIVAVDPGGRISSFISNVKTATVAAGQIYNFTATRLISASESAGTWKAIAQGDLANDNRPVDFIVGVASNSADPKASDSANPNIGKPCSATVKCPTPLLCTNNKCAEPTASKSADPNIGKACSATVKCPSPLVCTNNKCALQADPDASKAGALKACSTKYDLTKNPLKKNFGDPKCDFDKNKLYAQLKKEDPANADKWFNLVIPCHGNFNPNRYDKCIPTATTSCGGYDPAGMWGLFGMGRGLNGAYDKGDVPWGSQATNAITYNNKVLAPKGIAFKYWGVCVKSIWGSSTTQQPATNTAPKAPAANTAPKTPAANTAPKTPAANTAPKAPANVNPTPNTYAAPGAIRENDANKVNPTPNTYAAPGQIKENNMNK